MADPRYEPRCQINGVWFRACLDCGALMARDDMAAHTRFHSILGSHAWALAVLKTAHLAAHVHDRYEVAERIDSKKFDNWSEEAFTEVVGQLGERAPAEPGVNVANPDDHGVVRRLP